LLPAASRSDAPRALSALRLDRRTAAISGVPVVRQRRGRRRRGVTTARARPRRSTKPGAYDRSDRVLNVWPYTTALALFIARGHETGYRLADSAIESSCWPPPLGPLDVPLGFDAERHHVGASVRSYVRRRGRPLRPRATRSARCQRSAIWLGGSSRGRVCMNPPDDGAAGPWSTLLHPNSGHKDR